jgi:uncharacterized membrane protein
VTNSSGNRDQPVVSPGEEGPVWAGGDAAERSETAQYTLSALAAVREQLAALEESLRAAYHPLSNPTARLTHTATRGIAPSREAIQHVHLPAWLRPTRGESRWPVAAAIVVAIALQVALPDQLVVQSRWLLPSLELALLIALIVANPRRFDRESRAQRVASLTLSGLLSLANAWSATLLVFGLVHGREGQDAAPLLASGAAIWLTNIIAFGLWYWQFDRGGPAARAHAHHVIPDFAFVQMQTPELAPPEWEPGFMDYLYLSFTNATAFSPTDVMPLSRWAKLTMLTQSLVSLVTVALVIARAVNVLK